MKSDFLILAMFLCAAISAAYFIKKEIRKGIRYCVIATIAFYLSMQVNNADAEVVSQDRRVIEYTNGYVQTSGISDTKEYIFHVNGEKQRVDGNKTTVYNSSRPRVVASTLKKSYGPFYQTDVEYTIYYPFDNKYTSGAVRLKNVT